MGHDLAQQRSILRGLLPAGFDMERGVEEETKE